MNPMKKWITGLLLLIICTGAAWAEDRKLPPTARELPLTRPTASEELLQPLAKPPSAQQDGIVVFFSPKGGCTDAIVAEIARAKKKLLVQGYSFTSAPIAKAVSDAKHRGVNVTVVLDQSQRTAQYSSATYLFNAGVTTFIDDAHAIAHNKIVLVDGKVIITGSFNFSKAAEESNAENLLIIRDKQELTRAYEENFAAHLAHAKPYTGPARQAETPAALPSTRPGVGHDAPASDAAIDPTVHLTKSGKRYHLSGCKSLVSSDIPVSLSEAKQKGKTACASCRPPK